MMNKKIAMFTIAMVLLLGVTMGVTFALMSDTADSVTNTFVAGDFGTLTLMESNDKENYYAFGQAVDENVKDVTLNEDGNFAGFKYTLTPGATLNKAVKVNFKPTSAAVNAYLYVEFSGTNWSIKDKKLVYTVSKKDVLTAVISDEWEIVNDVNGIVFVYETNSFAAPADTSDIISTITVDSSLSLEEVQAAATNSALTINAYAVQKDQAGTDSAALKVAFPEFAAAD